jgi:hypothetical protein
MQTVLILPTTVIQPVLKILLRVVQYKPKTQRKIFKIPSFAMISANNVFTHILLYIIARNGHAEVTMSLNMRVMHSVFGEVPDCSTE